MRPQSGRIQKRPLVAGVLQLFAHFDFCDDAFDLAFRSQTSGANVFAFDRAVVVQDFNLLNVLAPGSSIFTVGVADFVAALLTFVAICAYSGHDSTS